MIKNISIKLKLLGFLSSILVFFIITWALSYQTSGKIGEYLDSSKIDMMRQADRLRQTLRDIEQLLNDAAQLHEPESVTEADERAKVFGRTLNMLSVLDSSRIEEYHKTQLLFDSYYTSARAAAIIFIRDETFSKEMLIYAERVKSTIPGLRERVEGIFNRSYMEFSTLLNQSTAAASRLANETSFILFLLLITSLVTVPIFIRTMTTPLARLVEATDELARGNLDVKAEVSAMDEIGNLAVAFNKMTGSLKSKSAALEKTTDELKKLNTELKEADRLKSEFVASMSHELRTPLNAIINYSEQIIEDWELIASDREWSMEARDMLGRVEASSKHLLALINELLDLAKIESGHMELKLEMSDIREIVVEAVTYVSSLAKKKGLQIGYEFPDDIREFPMDERKVLQVLINLLSNAIKFTEKGSVRTMVEKSRAYPGVLIKVSDTGIGIDDKQQSMIFDRFRQADGADSRRYAGTGLGLNLAKELVELHKGWIRVESEKKKGSVFTVYLPYDPVDSDMEDTDPIQ